MNSWKIVQLVTNFSLVSFFFFHLLKISVRLMETLANIYHIDFSIDRMKSRGHRVEKEAIGKQNKTKKKAFQMLKKILSCF